MIRHLFTLTALAGFAAMPVQAGDAASGEGLYKDVCAACHGRTGKGMASYPRIAGKEAEYLTDRLTTYRAGQRVGPNSMLMIPMAVNLSDEDIANLVAYLAKSG